MAHLYVEVVPAQHKRFRLPCLIFLQVIRIHVDEFLLKLFERLLFHSILKSEEVLNEWERQLASTVLFIEVVNKVFEVETLQGWLMVQKTSVMIDDNH